MTRFVCAPFFYLAAAALVCSGCGRTPPPASDTQLSKHGTLEVTAELLDIPGPFPSNDLYDYVYVMKYRVLQVHRGNAPTQEILVGHYNPLKPRSTAADDRSGEIGGRLEQFRVGDVHRMALAEPLDQNWMGGLIDKFFRQKGTRYWAIWTDPAVQ